MFPFLKSVARAYAGRYERLDGFCFVFPGKRAGTFFLKHLRREAGRRRMLAPCVTTVAELVSGIADRLPAGRVDLLFRLYRAYAGCWQGGEGEKKGEAPVDFDSFRGWGETVLSDFNEIDLYGVSPDEMFKNVRDYREIASNFLTDEQKRVMEEYFGRSAVGGEAAESFWRDFGDDDGGLSAVKTRFLYLWKVMAPLYHALDADLAADGLATTGGLYRLALERLTGIIEVGGDVCGIIPGGYDKVVFVGFNALSRVESEIFAALRDGGVYEGPEGEEPYADFWWDSTGPVLAARDNSAARFVASNRRRFPEPEWGRDILALSDTDRLPSRMRVIAAPSASIQAKLVSDEVERMHSEMETGHFADARVAVVLPDESLLLPMLYSLPDNVGTVNLTMGYPLRLTSVISFVGLLRRLQMRCRTSRGVRGYGHEELRLILAHPYSHAVLGTDSIQTVIRHLDSTHRRVLPVDELEGMAVGAAALFDAPGSQGAPRSVIAALDSVMARIDAALGLADSEGGLVKSRLDRGHIAVYRDALRRLADTLERHDTDMHWSTVYSLSEKLLAGEQVSFEGEPLQGLQVMGLLETRALDFDRIIIPSLNERVLPMRVRGRTFIPDTLRVAYGMPPANFQESLFAYYFYRMISRAEEVVMLYDARAGGGMRSGDVSRYLLQLDRLFAPGLLERVERRFAVGIPGGEPVEVVKNESVNSLLEEFTREEGGRNLSASALRRYCDCPVRFYYEVVVGLNTDLPSGTHIDALAQGNIVHDVMMRVYLPEESRRRLLSPGVEITAADVERIMRDRTGLRRLLVRAINSQHFNRSGAELDIEPEGETAMFADQLMGRILAILEHDRGIAPFTLYGVEVPGVERWELADGRRVNLKYAMDRVDMVETGGGRCLRVVDYKTGRVHLAARDMDSVFTDDYQARNIMQLMLYAHLLGRRTRSGRRWPVRMEIYDVTSIGGEGVCVPEVGRQEVGNNLEAYAETGETFDSEFASRFGQMLENIFNPAAPFMPTENESSCRTCTLSSLCRR